MKQSTRLFARAAVLAALAACLSCAQVAPGAQSSLNVRACLPVSRTVSLSQDDIGAAIAALDFAVVNGAGTTVASASVPYAAGTQHTFNFLPAGSYTVAVNGVNASGHAVVSGSQAISLTLGATATATVPLSLSRAGASGGFALLLEWPLSTGLAHVSATVDDPPVDLAVPTVNVGASSYTATISAANLSGGAHTLRLYFRTGAGAIPIGPLQETVNVWDRLTSTRWVDASGNLADRRSFSTDELKASAPQLLTVTANGASIVNGFSPDGSNFLLTDIAGATLSFVATVAPSTTVAAGGQNATYTWNGTAQAWAAAAGTSYTTADLAWTNGLNTLAITVTTAGLSAATTYNFSFTAVTAANLAAAMNANLAGAYLLTDDADLSAADWAVIGSPATPFTGSLDGRNHTVTIKTTTSANNRGFFGAVGAAGSVKNFNVLATMTSVQDGSGALAGLNCGLIENCSAQTAATVASGKSDIGGLVGINTGTIRGSHAVGTITMTGGWRNGSLAGTNTGIIEYCYASGSVAGGYADNGGLVGQNYGTGAIVRYCYATGNVSGESGVGGLVGDNCGGANTHDCFATGTVAGAGANRYIGGVVGLNQDAGSTFSNCYSTSIVTGVTSVGGALGLNSGATLPVQTYYNKDIFATAGYATGLTTAQMKDTANFAGWDFVTIWRIAAGEYPKLRGVGP